MYDSNTHELIKKLDSVTKGMKYAKVNFYTLKNLIDRVILMRVKYTVIKINYNILLTMRTLLCIATFLRLIVGPLFKKFNICTRLYARNSIYVKP